MANPHPVKRGPAKDKPFRAALQLAINEADGDIKRLRKVAEKLIEKAEGGDVSAIKEIADRLDGKVPQAIVGDDESDPIKIADHTDIERAKALANFIARTKAQTSE